MEPLRWILLVAGIAFVLLIYVFGRKRRRRNDMLIDETDDDLPEFSARKLDDLDEGVGEVRVIAGAGLAADRDDDFLRSDPEIDDDVLLDDSAEQAAETRTTETPTIKTRAQEETSAKEKKPERKSKNPPDLIVMFILPRAGELLRGSQINSSAQAMGLKFGEMNIFHYRPQGRIVFSLANMLEPGAFDPETFHDLKTSGLTAFMQISGDDPLDDLTEMLQRCYQLAGLLDARLCNHRREPLTEQDAENYRNKVSDFINAKAS